MILDSKAASLHHIWKILGTKAAYLGHLRCRQSSRYFAWCVDVRTVRRFMIGIRVTQLHLAPISCTLLSGLQSDTNVRVRGAQLGRELQRYKVATSLEQSFVVHREPCQVPTIGHGSTCMLVRKLDRARFMIACCIGGRFAINMAGR